MKKAYLTTLSVLIAIFLFTSEAVAFWVWTPKSKKLTNPKHAAKDIPEEQFKWAMQFFKDKDYKRSAEEFTSLTKQFSDSDIAPEAQYYVGRSYEECGKYYPAFLAYQKAIELYPFTKRVKEIIGREYDLGNLLYKKHRGMLMGREIMTDLDRAVEIFRKVKQNAPFGEYADRAQFMIGESYKKSEQYAEAADAFQKLADDYPQSRLAERAKYEVAQCTYSASLNPDYDQELTDEAIKRFKRIAETKKGLSLSEDAGKVLSSLEEKKAVSLFNTAKFYERQKHYKSAAIYYEEVLKKYPRSSYGELAFEKLEAIDEILKEERIKAEKKDKKKKKWIFF